MQNQNIDLTSCDREKIHLIASVQGHGAFLSLHRSDSTIRNVSENLSAYLGKSEESRSYLGKTLKDLLPFDLAEKILERIRPGGEYNFEVDYDTDRCLNVHIYKLTDELTGVEFELFKKTPHEDVSYRLNMFLEAMQSGHSIRQVSEIACEAVRFLTGYERVMIYRFFPPTMYGEVIAESLAPDAHSFLNHRFPATDIPKPARDLYLRNKIRYIHDSHGENFPITPQTDDKNESLNMSDSRLRSVSHIHIEYLKNMRVKSSMSVAIIVGGELWGIISCHHSGINYVSHAQRRLCQQVSSTFAMVAPLMENVVKFSLENAFYSQLYEIFNEIKSVSDPLDYLSHKYMKLSTLFNCQGMAHVTSKEVRLMGINSDEKNIRAIWNCLKKTMVGDVFETSSLQTLDPAFGFMREEISGVLAIRISSVDDSIMIFTRAESLRSIMWGGDPRKNLEGRRYNGTINPRASFETWTEVIKGTSNPWAEFEKIGALQFKSLVFDSIMARNMIIDELNLKLRK